jgi:hypothetical protein
MKINRTYLYYIFLFIIAFLALFPLITLQHPLKYDAIDQAYPWKYFIGECLREGILPLWNPYQLLGSPMHADPQSSAWYPVTWFFGYLFGYDIYVLSIDFFLHIFLAGMGMFYLGKQLKYRDEVAFVMGVAYMLSGFFVGNAQHFMWIISGTWIPFIIGAFIELKSAPGLRNAVQLALAAFMIMTGGYPAFIFLLIYLLSAIFILYLVQYLRNKEKKEALRYTGFVALAGIFSIMAGMVVLISVYHLQGEMTRGAGVTLRQALFGAFTPQSFISFILPFAAIRDMDVYGTDLSMSNGFFGIIPLVFFLVGLTIRKPSLVNLFLAWGLFCLAAAVGSALPLREFLYHYAPGMNYFRFPALFRVFFIVSFLIVAGHALNQWREGMPGMAKKMRLIIIGMMVVVSGFIVYALVRGNLNLAGFVKNELLIFSKESRIVQHIFVQGIFQLILLSLLLLVILRWSRMKNALVLILLILSVDLILATRLNGPYTVYSHLFRSKEVKAHAGHFPEGFPVPGNEAIIRNTDSRGLVFQTLWRNLNIFHKQVSFEGYNPLHLKGFEELADNHTALFETILRNPLVYLSGQVSPMDSLALHEKAGDFDPGRVYFEDEVYNLLNDISLVSAKSDTAYIRAFSPVKIVVGVSTHGPALLNVLQNNYPGWHATIDGRSAELHTGNLSFLAVDIPAGEHEVIFEFDPKDVRFGFWVTVIGVVGMLIFWVWSRTLTGL